MMKLFKNRLKRETLFKKNAKKVFKSQAEEKRDPFKNSKTSKNSKGRFFTPLRSVQNDIIAIRKVLALNGILIGRIIGMISHPLTGVLTSTPFRKFLGFRPVRFLWTMSRFTGWFRQNLTGLLPQLFMKRCTSSLIGGLSGGLVGALLTFEKFGVDKGSPTGIISGVILWIFLILELFYQVPLNGLIGFLLGIFGGVFILENDVLSNGLFNGLVSGGFVGVLLVLQRDFDITRRQKSGF